MKQHTYHIAIEWTGNQGEGTKTYRAYRRTHVIRGAGKPEIPGSSDPVFRGDVDRYNPEDLLVSALSGCHMLSYLHLCAVNEVVVLEYTDDAEGVMEETADGGGHFVRATLHPRVTIAETSDREKAKALHADAHHLCFIASSVNFPVEVEATIVLQASIS